jgi:hypothetical protein
MVFRYEVALLNPAKCAVILCCLPMTLMSLTPRKSFVRAPQSAASPMAQISATPKPEDLGLPYGSIEGEVVDPDGKRVEGAVVHESSDDGRPVQGRIFRTSTTTDADGKFVLDHVIPAEKVIVWAYKYDDYFDDVMEPFSFKPPNVKMPVVEVKPGQTITGVRIQFAEKAGKLHLYVRDADSKELVHGVFIRWCRKGDPPKYCINGSGPSDDERLISPAVGISIQIEADDGLHEKSEYRNPKTGSRYFRAKSGETETVNIYLRKKRR